MYWTSPQNTGVAETYTVPLAKKLSSGAVCVHAYLHVYWPKVNEIIIFLYISVNQ